MATEVLKSFNALQNELEQAKSSLKVYDESIKRLIGRDPSEGQPIRGGGNKRPVVSNEEHKGRFTENIGNRFNNAVGGRFNANVSGRFNENPPGRFNETTTNRFTDNARLRNQHNVRVQMYESSESPNKRRNLDSSVFKRLDKPRYTEEDDFPNKPQMSSRVIVQPREVPSRQDALKAQDNDEKSKARNRRMFGALLGTLQKFRQEETKHKPIEDKRAQVEKKLEEQEILEKAQLKKERYELFMGRKKKQQEIRMLEQKMLRMKEQSDWEEKQKPLVNFIQTKAKPHIHYLPRRINTKTKELLEESKKQVEKMIEEKRQKVLEEIDIIEKRHSKQITVSETKEHEDGDENDEIENEDEAHQMLDEIDANMPVADLENVDGEIMEELNMESHADCNTSEIEMNFVKQEIETKMEVEEENKGVEVESPQLKTNSENLKTDIIELNVVDPAVNIDNTRSESDPMKAEVNESGVNS